MIIVSAALVGVAVLLLLVGVFNDSGQAFLFGSMGASILSFVALALGVRAGRKQMAAESADADTVGPIVIDEPATVPETSRPSLETEAPARSETPIDRPPTVRVAAPPPAMLLDDRDEQERDAFDDLEDDDDTATERGASEEIVVRDPVARTARSEPGAGSAARAKTTTRPSSARSTTPRASTTRSTASGSSVRSSASRAKSAAEGAKKSTARKPAATGAKKTTARKTAASGAKKSTASGAKKTTAKKTTAKKPAPRPRKPASDLPENPGDL